jgi:predicted outer membrane protein
MDQKHQSALTKIQSRSGADFDREYMKTMVNDHSKMLSLLQKQADKGTDADFKAHWPLRWFRLYKATLQQLAHCATV